MVLHNSPGLVHETFVAHFHIEPTGISMAKVFRTGTKIFYPPHQATLWSAPIFQILVRDLSPPSASQGIFRRNFGHVRIPRKRLRVPGVIRSSRAPENLGMDLQAFLSVL